MNKIIQKQQFSEKVFKFEIEAPLIAKSRKAGNFVIIRVDKNSERMPLTIADADTHRGTITLVVQEVGLSSRKLCRLSEGDYVEDVVGPLGSPTHIQNFGTVVCAGGGAPKVVAQVTAAVKTALDISSAKITVSKISSGAAGH